MKSKNTWLNWLNQEIQEPDPVRLTFDDKWPRFHKIVIGILVIIAGALLVLFALLKAFDQKGE